MNDLDTLIRAFLNSVADPDIHDLNAESNALREVLKIHRDYYGKGCVECYDLVDGYCKTVRTIARELGIKVD